MAKKTKTKEEQSHMRAVAELGCIICDKVFSISWKKGTKVCIKY